MKKFTTVYRTAKAKRVLPIGTRFQFNARVYELTTSTATEWCQATLVEVLPGALPSAEVVGQSYKFWSPRVGYLAN